MWIEAASLYKLENIGGMPNLSSFFSRNQEGWIFFLHGNTKCRICPFKMDLFYT